MTTEITHVSPATHDYYDLVCRGGGQVWSPDSVGSIHEARQWAHHALHGAEGRMAGIEQVDIHGGSVPSYPGRLGPLVEAHSRAVGGVHEWTEPHDESNVGAHEISEWQDILHGARQRQAEQAASRNIPWNDRRRR